MSDFETTNVTEPQGPEPPTTRRPRPVLWALVGLLLGVGVTAAAAWLVLAGRPAAPIATGGGPATAVETAHDHEGEELWTCPMHPQILRDGPGACPICGMDLVPVADDGGGEVAAPAGVNQGAVVRIDPAVVQNMNVTTTLVHTRDVAQTIRTVGTLDYAQDAMVTVTTKYPGFVEKVYVNAEGEMVRRGQPLFEIYSPELVQTQQELLSAIRYAQRMADAPESTRERAEGLVEAATERLRYWDISKAQIQHLLQGGEPRRTLTVTAPSSGLIMQLVHGLPGMRIQPGMDVIHIADISRLWLQAEMFEDQLRWVSVGTPARVEFPYLQGRAFTGQVKYIQPQVADATRTVQLVIEVPNPGGQLRTGMYATVVFEPLDAEDALVVPKQAVLRTGTRSVVVMALGEGRFAPREVILGAESGEWIQVLSGLDRGDRIVTSSQFLIDSESNLLEAIRKMRSGVGAAAPASAAAADAHQH